MRESKSYQATNGKTIICKAAVAWATKQPLDVTDILVCIVFSVVYFEFLQFMLLFIFRLPRPGAQGWGGEGEGDQQRVVSHRHLHAGRP